MGISVICVNLCVEVKQLYACIGGLCFTQVCLNICPPGINTPMMKVEVHIVCWQLPRLFEPVNFFSTLIKFP